ncbi:hypothetical protein HYPBUDRAFT_153268 [Hyphopichia burtonii NRRL Y-1933]|uniref:Glucosidase 2 subunit beta n=1 Tax=Hyphopichia burtonii NRRL Y-1933 TaxID=984485 RepID=A0A1E4RGN1_9ASCO|nr:hypothetical protein HYPBUDRAFT_153268 [Hyphopichia burtonii NRRL Y-1933]ODV66419.1 hypothetical protein HYPBUDRAFT_153268 [Hyphopichia burtonii NRRL Y-1933]
MKLATYLLSILAINALGCSAYGTVTGVPPSKQKLYEPTIDSSGRKTWHCLSDPSIVLSYDQINDNYCDCPDGSDEPGTNACPYNPEQKFYCANEGYVSGYIENFKLNDGVCDYDLCCDGSDEYLTGKCPNKCEEIRQQFENYKELVYRETEESLLIKEQMVEKAKIIKEKVTKKLEETQQEIHAKEKELEELSVQLRDEEIRIQLEPEISEDLSSSIFEEVSPLLNDLVESIKSHTEEKKSQELRLEKLEELLSNLIENYNPNFNDQVVKQTVNKFQDYLSNLEEASNNEKASPHSVLESLSEKLKEFACHPVSTIKKNVDELVNPTFSNMINFYYTTFFKSNKGQKSDKPVDLSDSKKSQLAFELEDKIQDLKKAIKSLQSEAAVYQENLEIDFGKDEILRAVAGSWVNDKFGEYDYRVGFLDSIYQDKTLIGRFVSYENGRLKYAKGTKCWNGPHRSGEVELLCGPKNELVAVSELEKCEYLFQIRTPIACEKITDDYLIKNFKVDYSLL